MARRLKRKEDTYQEEPFQRSATLSAPAHPPGPDPHLGKQTTRYIAERFVGELVSSERTGNAALKAKGKREISLERLAEILRNYTGFRVELTIYEDADPDVGFRLAEALQGLEEDSFTWEGPSVYVARINWDLTRAFPERAYFVTLSGQTITIYRIAPGPRIQCSTLESPALGWWKLVDCRPGQSSKDLELMSFKDALDTVIRLEKL